jgi:hypothetical protein
VWRREKIEMREEGEHTENLFMLMIFVDLKDLTDFVAGDL